MFRKIKKEEKKRNVGVHDRYGDLRKSRSKRFNLKKHRLSLPKIKLGKFPLKAAAIVSFIALIILSIGMLITLPQFEIVTINIRVNGEITSLPLTDKFKNENIFLTTDLDIYNAVKDSLELPDTIYVQRELPNIINVIATTRSPEIAFLSFSTHCIYDQNIEEISCDSENEFRLTEFEQQLLTGSVDKDAAFIQETYAAALSEEEREGLEWKDVKDEEKLELINKLKEDVVSRKESYIVNRKDDILQQANVPILIFEGYFDDINAEKRKNRLLLAKEISSDIYFLSDSVKEMDLFTPFDLRIETEDKYYLFSAFRSVREQIDDITALKTNDKSKVQFENAAGVDVRSDKLILIER